MNRVSRNGTRYEFELNLPKLQGKGNYEISGQLLSLPIRGNGPFTGNFCMLKRAPTFT